MTRMSSPITPEKTPATKPLDFLSVAKNKLQNLSKQIDSLKTSPSRSMESNTYVSPDSKLASKDTDISIKPTPIQCLIQAMTDVTNENPELHEIFMDTASAGSSILRILSKDVLLLSNEEFSGEIDQL